MRTSRVAPALTILLAMNAAAASFGRPSSDVNGFSAFDSAGLSSILAPLAGGASSEGLLRGGGLGAVPALSALSQSQETDGQGAAAGAEAGAGGSGGSQNEANNPLTPKVTFNLHNYYVPSYYGLDDRSANQFLLRGLLPHKVGGTPQLFRFTLPIAEAPTFPGGTDTGLGDLTLIDWFMFKDEKAGLEFGVGPMLVLPTASEETTGAGKWQVGVSGVAVSPQKWGILGGLITFQQSVASQGGDHDRPDVTLLTLQPLLIYNLPEGFYLRSTAIWNFNLDNGDYFIPVGLGGGFVRQEGNLTVNISVEPQFTVFHDGVAPQWQIFAGINFQFAF